MRYDPSRRTFIQSLGLFGTGAFSQTSLARRRRPLPGLRRKPS